MTAFVGLDVGTSAVKAILVDEAEALIAGASVPLSTSRPQPLWSEQDPEDWWSATEKAFAELRGSAPQAWSGVKAIGLSGQMHGAVLLDRDGKIIRPAILWNDGRAEAEARELNAAVPDIGRIAGVPAMAGFTAPKLIWLARHEPHRFQSIAKILLPKDYVRFRMTGKHATDMTDASGTLWLDVAKRKWSEEIVAASGIAAEQLPDLHEGSDPAGRLRPELAQAWGLSPDTIVAIGTGDAAAAALGLGAIAEGDAFISLGTSAQYFIAADRHRPSPETLVHAYAHALPGRWFQMAALLNGASVLGWAAGLFRGTSIEALLAETEAQFSQPSALTCLPYLAGERTPHNDPHAKGAFYGLTPGATRAGIIQAVLEGVAFALADGQDALAQAGASAGTLAVTGGGARSPLWMRILANVLDRELSVHAGSALGPALGAARLARLAFTGETLQNVCRAPPGAALIRPDPALAAAYGDKRLHFQILSASLRGMSRPLAARADVH